MSTLLSIGSMQCYQCL